MSTALKSRLTRTLPLLVCVPVLSWNTLAFAQPEDTAEKPAAADAPATPAAAEAEVAKGPKLLMLPYQPIFRTVDQDKAAKATEYLNKSLSEDIVVIRGGVADEGAVAPSLETAIAAAKAAEEAEVAKDIVTAVQKRKEVLLAMEANASALDDAEQYAVAQHYLARALMWSGADADAKAVMTEAARMNPAQALKPSEFSRLYRAWFLKIAKAVVTEKPGELLVKSVLPGATIEWDGRAMDVAPVLLQQAVPGKHLLGAVVDGVPPYKAIVEVKSGKKTEYRVTFGGTLGGVEVGEVTDAISTNTLSKAAVQAAVTAGKNAGAEYVLAGGMSKGEDHFKMHTFVVEVKTGKMQPLDVVKFDLDLLTAEADVIRIARQVETAMKTFSAPKPMIAMIDAGVRSSTTINEVDARPDTSSLSSRSKSRNKDDDDGKPRRVFGAVKGGKIKIKED